jgi:phosphotransferase system enzyme I (PtsI)
MSFKEQVIKGLPAAPGIAIGPIFKYWGHDIFVEKISLNSEEKIQEEIQKFRNAVTTLLKELEAIRKSTVDSYGEQLAELFELQIGLLKDEILLREIEEKIISEKINATYSIFEILRMKKEHFLNLQNEYFRNRAYEVQDLKRKLIAKISGKENKFLQKKPSIVVAHDLTPADTMRFFQQNVLGYVTETGGINSHAAIMAKALEIPSVVGCDGILEAAPEDTLAIVDGFKGIVILDPERETVEAYTIKRKMYESSLRKIRKSLKKVTHTLDGTKVYVDANLEFVEEIDIIKKYKANGIGLFRTEGVFLQSTVIPSEEEQYKIYKQVAGEKQFEHVTIRTLDLGGDKILPELQSMEEKNPFLGWRAIRFCLDMPEIFRTQIRAILRANEHGNIRILLPFISTYNEILKAKQIISEEQEKLNKEGYKVSDQIQIGLMIETPAAVILADTFAEEVDFFSIGTNDLTQYILAVDRNNPKIAEMYSTFNPAVLRAIKDVILVGKEHGIDVEMCGEMAGNPLAIPLLVGFGLRIFSVGHTHIPTVKKIVSNIEVKEVEQLANEILKLKTAFEVEKVLKIHFKEKFPELEISQI